MPMKRRKRRIYRRQEIARIAAMAGAGNSAAEIAEAIGEGATPSKIYSLLSSLGLHLAPKRSNEVGITIAVDRRAFEAIGVHARDAGMCPEVLAARLLREIADEPDLLRSLAVDACYALRA